MSMLFADTLKKLRTEKGLSQRELAERMYVTRTAITKWESGNRLPDAATIRRIQAESQTIIGKRKNTKKVSYFLLTNEQMFCITIFLILSHFAGKPRKPNNSVNIFAGFTPDNAAAG